MVLPSIFRREATPRPSQPQEVREKSVLQFTHADPDANRLALLELLRAWEAGKIRELPNDEKERSALHVHLERTMSRYSMRVKNMVGLASTVDLEIATTALKLIQSDDADPSEVRAELSRLFRSGRLTSSKTD